jgi:glycosyltransferase involved in cell wall biosynthesis
MVVDFRDLWSDHHDPTRFIPRQKQLIRKFEKKLLERTALISAPQKHMITLLKKWAHVPLYHLPHSAYVGKDWEDGKVVNNEFRMLYAGKLYSNGPGITMLLDLIKKMSKIALPRPFKCHFFVDEADTLKKLAIEKGISENIVINEWVSPWQLWKNLRSAHLLVVIDSATEENYPILLTKTFQYAYSGQQLLCLQKYENKEMHEFLQRHHAGMVSTSTSEAATWISSLAADLNIYETLPPLRSTIAQREDVAEAYGKEINNIINKKIHKEL